MRITREENIIKIKLIDKEDCKLLFDMMNEDPKGKALDMCNKILWYGVLIREEKTPACMTTGVKEKE